MTKYYDAITETFKEIPESMYYILSNDTFMSNWGKSDNKINVCIVPCENKEQCGKVMRYLKTRSDQKYIRKVIHKPRARKDVIYSLIPNWLNIAMEMN